MMFITKVFVVIFAQRYFVDGDNYGDDDNGDDKNDNGTDNRNDDDDDSNNNENDDDDHNDDTPSLRDLSSFPKYHWPYISKGHGLASTENLQRHNMVATYLHWSVCRECNINRKGRKMCFDHEPKTVNKNITLTVSRDMAITDRPWDKG